MGSALAKPVCERIVQRRRGTDVEQLLQRAAGAEWTLVLEELVRAVVVSAVSETRHCRRTENACSDQVRRNVADVPAELCAPSAGASLGLRRTVADRRRLPIGALEVRHASAVSASIVASTDKLRALRAGVGAAMSGARRSPRLSQRPRRGVSEAAYVESQLRPHGRAIERDRGARSESTGARCRRRSRVRSRSHSLQAKPAREAALDRRGS